MVKNSNAIVTCVRINRHFSECFLHGQFMYCRIFSSLFMIIDVSKLFMFGVSLVSFTEISMLVTLYDLFVCL